jgi:sugar phosphate isomerase/epimerase
MQLRLACADFAFPLLPHRDVFKLIAMLGFEGIDIGLFEGRSHLQPSHVLDNLARSASELSTQIRDQGLELADIFYQTSSFPTLAANHPDPIERGKGRDLFLRMLEFTLRCNAPHMTALPGVDWPAEPHDTSLKRCAEELAWRVEQARQAGVVYSVEAHLQSVVPTPAGAKQLVEMTPGLTLTVDYTHFTYQGYSDDDCETLIPYAAHFHARCARRERVQAPVKDNTIDYHRVLRAMERANYLGYVGVEYVWIDWIEHLNDVDNLSETIQLRDQLRAAMASGGQ